MDLSRIEPVEEEKKEFNQEVDKIVNNKLRTYFINKKIRFNNQIIHFKDELAKEDYMKVRRQYEDDLYKRYDKNKLQRDAEKRLAERSIVIDD